MHPFAQHGGRFQVKGLQAMHCRAGRRRWQHVGRFMKSGKSFPRTRWPPNHFCRREKLNNKLSNEVELESAAIALYFPAHPGSIMAAPSTFIIIAICSNRITIKTKKDCHPASCLQSPRVSRCRPTDPKGSRGRGKMSHSINSDI